MASKGRFARTRPTGSSLYIFSSTNKFRLLLHRATSSVAFEYFILLAIAASCIVATQSAHTNFKGFSDPFAVLDFLLNLVFVLEIIAKVIAHGLLFLPHAYLRTCWNQFDLLVVVVGIASDIMTAVGKGGSTGSVKFLRLFRVFRPLRLVAKLENLRVVTETLLQSFKILLHVSMFIALLILLYAITGMELFAGKLDWVCFSSMTGQVIQPVKSCNGRQTNACWDLPNATCKDYWPERKRSLESFDNIGIAVMTILQVITMQDWVFLAYKLELVSPAWLTWMYFGTLIIFGGYFAVNLLMGVLGNKYAQTKQAVKSFRRCQKQRKLAKEKALANASQCLEAAQVCTASEIEDLQPQHATFWKNCLLACLYCQACCKKVESHPAFRALIMLLLAADGVISAVCAHMQSAPHTKQVLEYWKITALCGYFLELALVVLAKGFVQNVRSAHFVYRSIILVLSTIDVVMHETSGSRLIGVSSVRCVGLIEILKVTRFWKQLASIIHSFVESVRGVLGLAIFLVILLIIYALLGNQLFGQLKSSWDEFGEFNSFFQSLLLSFVLLTLDGWPGLMSSVIESTTSTWTHFAAVMYFLSFVLFGNFILMNIFLSIIIDNLTNDFEDMENSNKTVKEQLDTLNLQAYVAQDTPPAPTNRKRRDESESLEAVKCQSSDGSPLESETTKSALETTTVVNKYALALCPIHLADGLEPSQTKAPEVNKRPRNSPRVRILAPGRSADGDDSQLRRHARTLSLVLDFGVMGTAIPKHNSLFVFSHRNMIRRYVWILVTSSTFNLTTAIAILISSLAMAFDDPVGRDSTRSKAIDYIDCIFTAFFALEILLKSIAYGFVFGHKHCYMRNALNVLDAVVVATSVADLTLESGNSGAYSHLRVLRVLRVLRMLQVSSSLKQVTNCLIQSIQKLSYFLVLYILILLVYSIMGVQVYSGFLGTCSNSSYGLSSVACLAANYSWKSGRSNFDDFGESFATLFRLSTGDAWSGYLAELSKLPDHSSLFSISYIVSFILTTNFIMLNGFVALVIVVFYQEKAKAERFKVLGKSAQECFLAALSEQCSNCEGPESCFRKRLWVIVNSKWFSTASLVLIVINTVILMIKFKDQGKILDKFQDIANLIFTILFTLECSMKLIAMSPKRFIKDYWCSFDAIVILGSWIDIIANSLSTTFFNTSVLRLFRAVRLIKIFGKDGELRQLFSTLLNSLKSFPSIALLVGFIIYVYSVLGMQIFGKIRIDPSTEINEHVNFQSFTSAAAVLLRVTTLDGWSQVMTACADVTTKNCALSDEGNCGSYFSYPYFVSYVFITSFLMTNLFLAVIMNNFVYLTRDYSELDTRHILSFKASWMTLDQSGTGKIPVSRIANLLQLLNPPLGCGFKCPERSIYSKLLRLRIPIGLDQTVDFSQTLLTLVLHSLKIKASNVAIRDDLEILCPKANEELLDRILPCDEGPPPTTVEVKFYRECASRVIVGYFKLYRQNIRKKYQDKETVARSHNEQLLVPSIDRDPLIFQSNSDKPKHSATTIFI